MLFSTNSDKSISINDPEASIFNGRAIRLYRKIDNPSWSALFNTISSNGWIGRVLHIIFFYDHSINSDVILAVQQPINNAKVVGILEGYTASNHTFSDTNQEFEHDSNDSERIKDDNGFVYESNAFMNCLTENNLLDQELQVFHKVNKDRPRRIVWSNDNITEKIFYASDFHFKECYYVIINDAQPPEIERYFDLNPSFLFVRQH